MLEFRTGIGPALHRAGGPGDGHRRVRAQGHAPSAGTRPTGFRHPGLHEYEGEGGLAWVRTFSGLLVTCGLDHILGPEEVPADSYDYPGRKTVRHSLHGRVGDDPGAADRLWRGVGRRPLHALGRGRGAAGDRVRRGPAPASAGSRPTSAATRSASTDRVVNRGFCRTPHMFFYHVNVGYPVLDEGTRYLAPITRCALGRPRGRGVPRAGRRLPTAARPAAALSRAGLAA